jgi:hypothetical protein
MTAARFSDAQCALLGVGVPHNRGGLVGWLQHAQEIGTPVVALHADILSRYQGRGGTPVVDGGECRLQAGDDQDAFAA